MNFSDDVNEIRSPTSEFPSMIVSAQIRMARAALGWSVRTLAEASGIADSTILRFETGRGGILAANLAKLQIALEDGGVIFVAADAHGGPGIRLKGLG